MKIRLLLAATTCFVVVLLGHVLLAEPTVAGGVALAKEPEARILVMLGAALLVGAALLRRLRVRY